MNQIQISSQGSKGEQGTIRSRWDKLNSLRYSLLQRNRQCAELTIPSLLPPDGHTETQDLPTPYQSLGARGVNNLASKLLLALLPPNSPFFKMAVDDFTLEQLTQQKGMRAEVEEALNKIERAIATSIETQAIRVQAFAAMKYLVCIGNALLYLPDKGGMKVYRLDNYVVKRDPMGNVLEIIIHEKVSPLLLPEKIKPTGTEKVDPEASVDVYTQIIRKDNMWRVRQEAYNKIVPETEGSYPLDECPWIPLRWTAIDGEDYGRGLIEEYLGDLRSLEGLSQSILEGTAASAKVLFLVSPNGTTKIKTLAESKSGDIKTGNAADVSVLQVEKFNDFRVALDTISKIEQRLSQAFLLMSSVQRDAERVTAEEIRLMAAELEDALGGVYSVLSQEFQLPLVNRLMSQMRKKGNLPPLPKDKIKPMITTGLEALGRGHDANKLDIFINSIVPLGAEVIAQYINLADFIKRKGTALGIDMEGLVKSEEEVQQSQQQAMMMQTLQQAAPGAVNQLTKGVMDNVNIQTQGAMQNG